MVIEHGERMASPSFVQSKVSLVVHLPKLIRRRALETLKRAVLARLVLIELSMTTQNLGDRARGRRGKPLTQQRRAQLSRPLTSDRGQPPAGFGAGEVSMRGNIPLSRMSGQVTCPRVLPPV